MEKTVIRAIASTILALKNSNKHSVHPIYNHWYDMLKDIEKNHLPSGSGFDAGTTILINESKRNKIKLKSAYHFMDDMGGYNGWAEFIIEVTPSLICSFIDPDGIDVELQPIGKWPKKYSHIKEHIIEDMEYSLTREYNKSIKDFMDKKGKE